MSAFALQPTLTGTVDRGQVRAYWGGEYNGEMKRLMLEHAFRFVKRVVFVIGVENLRSQKAVEKIGGELLRSVERTAPDGTIRRNVVFAITRQLLTAIRICFGFASSFFGTSISSTPSR